MITPDQLFFTPASAIISPNKATVFIPPASTTSIFPSPLEFKSFLTKELSSGH